MKRIWNRHGAFTLIELLVVITIITILAALLVPAVRGALRKGQALAVGNDGRQVWMGLYATSSDRDVSGHGKIWPSSDDYDNSTDFFRDCIANEWLGDNYTFSFMGAPGLPRAFTDEPTEFLEENNAWCVVLDAGSASKDEMPFLFTRNLAASSGGGTIADIDSLAPDTEPFGSSIGVIVTFGGAVKLITEQSAAVDFQKAFNPYGADNAFAEP